MGRVRIARYDGVVYGVDLRVRFRGLTRREGVIFEGPAGWAEFSPFWDYGPDDAAAWLNAALETAERGFPPARRAAIPVNVTVPAVGPERAAQIVQASGGCRTAKVKVAEPGQSQAQEAARLAAVRDAIGPTGAIRVDANGAWDLATARDRLAVLNRAAGGLEYAEQPCRDVRDLARLRRLTNVPIAADESIRRAADPFEVARLQAADVVVLKVQPLGGIWACLELADRIGLPVVVSSALETSVGLAAGLALAAALPDLPFACGLATSQLLAVDATTAPLKPVDGAIAVRPVMVDNLPAIAADDAAARRWQDRLNTLQAAP